MLTYSFLHILRSRAGLDAELRWLVGTKRFPNPKHVPKSKNSPELFISQTFSRVQANATLSAIVGRLHEAFTRQINLSSHLPFFRTRQKSELNHMYITIVVSRLFKKRSPVFVASVNSNVHVTCKVLAAVACRAGGLFSYKSVQKGGTLPWGRL